MLPDAGLAIAEEAVYLRKLNRNSDWDKDNVLESVSKIMELGTESDATISLYRASSNREICLTLAVLNGGRTSDVQEMSFLYITESELRSAGLIPHQEDDNISCMHGRSLHYNLKIGRGSAEQLLTGIAKSGRCVLRISRKQAQSIKEHLLSMFCRAFKPYRQSPEGHCSECNLNYS